jgi:hypothetical protein
MFETSKRQIESPENRLKYRDHDKALVFDLDKPDDIRAVLLEIKADGRFDMYCSNLCFEVWLLMHFGPVSGKCSTDEMKDRLSRHLGGAPYTKKADEDIPRVLKKGSIPAAIQNAEKRAALSPHLNLTEGPIPEGVKDIQPYTNVHELVKRLMPPSDRLTK